MTFWGNSPHVFLDTVHFSSKFSVHFLLNNDLDKFYTVLRYLLDAILDGVFHNELNDHLAVSVCFCWITVSFFLSWVHT